MKNKIILILLCLISLPNITFAVQGACSYHSGVNCSAGSSYTGKVQCNDGWIDSSVYFSDANECKISKSLCSIPLIGGSTDLSMCDQYQNICDSYDVSMGIANSRTGGTYTKLPCDKAISCRQEVENYNKIIAGYNNCIETEKKLQILDQQFELDRKRRDSETQNQALNKQLELINQNKVLQEENDKLKSEQGAQDLIQFSKDTTEEIIKNRKLEEKPSSTKTTGTSTTGNFWAGYKEPIASKLPVYIAPTQPDVISAPVPTATTPVPKRNIFYRFWKSIINFF